MDRVTCKKQMEILTLLMTFVGNTKPILVVSISYFSSEKQLFIPSFHVNTNEYVFNMYAIVYLTSR